MLSIEVDNISISPPINRSEYLTNPPTTNNTTLNTSKNNKNNSNKIDKTSYIIDTLTQSSTHTTNSNSIIPQNIEIIFDDIANAIHNPLTSLASDEDRNPLVTMKSVTGNLLASS